MKVQTINNNPAFGTKVFVMPNATRIMEKYYTPKLKRAINTDILKLVNANAKTNDVVILDTAYNERNTLSMTCYKMEKDKLFKSDYSEYIPLRYIKSWISHAYQSLNNNRFMPVEESCFDKHNPMLDIIKNACKPN